MSVPAPELLWARTLRRIGGLKGIHKHITRLVRCNVVAHASYGDTSFRTRVYGRRARSGLSSRQCVALADNAVFKPGVVAQHMRFNTYPARKNDGKFLVFQPSSNAIRAGKHTIVDAVKGLIVFNAWMRRHCRASHVWHTAIACPNMVMSGKLRTRASGDSPTHNSGAAGRALFDANHWRCNSSPKFPGVAVQTSTRATPEVYPNTGAFIIPGIVSARCAKDAIACIAETVQSAARDDAADPRSVGQHACVGN